MSAVPGLWTTSRRELLSALLRIDGTIGGMYQWAIQALSTQPRGMASLNIAAHCIREIANALPDALGDVDGLPGRSDTSAPSQQLAKRWEEHVEYLGDPKVPTVVTERSDVESVSMVSVPVEIVEAARVVVVAVQTGTVNGHLRRSALVLGRLDPNRDVSVGLFKSGVDYFMRYVHLSSALKHPLPDEKEVLRHLQTVEDALLARVGRFFATAEEILDIVAAANRRKAP